MNADLIKGILLISIAHACTVIQLNGQFKWQWFKDNEWLVVLFGIPVAYIYIRATRELLSGLGGIYWPIRFIGFGVGVTIYALFVSFVLGEGINIKTIVSLILSAILISIQIFWK